MRDGLYAKYTITHKDGKPLSPDEALFVLNPAKDPASRVALAAYADACEEKLPRLAIDLRYWLSEIEESKEQST